jgi:hypothetical protein
MKVDAKITILASEDGVRIEIEDADANTTICEVTLSPEDFVIAAMARHACVRCVADVPFPERIGTKHENKYLEFPLSIQERVYEDRNVSASADADLHCPEGWLPDYYFGSQNSFFNKDGERWARCTIRRYVPKTDHDPRTP